jgi:hypothetical protein
VGAEYHLDIPVTIDDGKPFSWLGRIGGTLAEHFFDEDLSPAALDILADACDVEIFDPQWGRNSLLWPTLTAAFERS